MVCTRWQMLALSLLGRFRVLKAVLVVRLVGNTFFLRAVNCVIASPNTYSQKRKRRRAICSFIVKRALRAGGSAWTKLRAAAGGSSVVDERSCSAQRRPPPATLRAIDSSR